LFCCSTFSNKPKSCAAEKGEKVVEVGIDEAVASLLIGFSLNAADEDA
jgi:hypothetical protein